MDRRFVYRTVPEIKFQLTTSRKPMAKKDNKHTYSQKCLMTEDN